jgi:uncharacterized peroxidase-related enzyme
LARGLFLTYVSEGFWVSTSEHAVVSGRLLASRSRLHLPVVEEPEATGEVGKVYAEFREYFGRTSVPGILKCFSSSPEMLKIILQLGKTLVFSEGVLGRRTKEMIATYVSALNDCPYCLDSHAASLRMQGGDDELLSGLLAGDLNHAGITMPESLLLEFVRKVTLESHSVDDDDILNLRASGWDEMQIAESIHVAGMFACFNRVANAFGLPSQELLKGLRENGR